MKTHAAAALLPEMSDDELRDLVVDIREHGLRVPIVTLDDAVLDGRSRLKACRLAKVEPRFTKWRGSDPIAYVLSLNLHRRHLSESQRGMVAVDVEVYYAAEASAREKAGKKVDPPPPGEEGLKGEALQHAAKAVGSSRTSAARAKRVVKEAPDLAKQVRTGDLTVKEAEREVQQRQQAEYDKRNESFVANLDPVSREGYELSQYRAHVAKAVSQASGGLLTFEPERVAQSLEPLDIAHYEFFCDQLEEWAGQLRRALRPLQVVRGGKS